MSLANARAARESIELVAVDTAQELARGHAYNAVPRWPGNWSRIQWQEYCFWLEYYVSSFC